METTKSKKHPFLIYVLPLLHLIACLISFIGYVIPSLQFLGIVWVGLMLVDLPISAIGYALAWQHGTFTVIWVAVVGTLWWYLLSLGAERLINKFRGKFQAGSGIRSAKNS